MFLLSRLILDISIITSTKWVHKSMNTKINRKKKKHFCSFAEIWTNCFNTFFLKSNSELNLQDGCGFVCMSVFHLKHLTSYFTCLSVCGWIPKYVLHVCAQHYEAMVSWKPHTSSSEIWKLSAHRGGLSKVVQLPVRPWFSSESIYRALPLPPPDRKEDDRVCMSYQRSALLPSRFFNINTVSSTYSDQHIWSVWQQLSASRHVDMVKITW